MIEGALLVLSDFMASKKERKMFNCHRAEFSHKQC